MESDQEQQREILVSCQGSDIQTRGTGSKHVPDRWKLSAAALSLVGLGAGCVLLLRSSSTASGDVQSLQQLSDACPRQIRWTPNPSLCLAVSGLLPPANGDPILLVPCDDNTTEGPHMSVCETPRHSHFLFSDGGYGGGKIRLAAKPNLCIEIFEHRRSDIVHLSDCQENNAQQDFIVSERIFKAAENSTDSKCLDVQDATYAWSHVVAKDCIASEAQRQLFSLSSGCQVANARQRLCEADSDCSAGESCSEGRCLLDRGAQSDSCVDDAAGLNAALGAVGWTCDHYLYNRHKCFVHLHGALPQQRWCPVSCGLCADNGGTAARCPSRRGSFLVVGDWGFDKRIHGGIASNDCQRVIADQMLSKFEELGDVQFIINVGDSFYPAGVRGKWDPQWNEKWRNNYPKRLRSVPWYSVYGNHDLHHDPGVCSRNPAAGAQINGDIEDLNFFYMPEYNWFLEHHDLNLEVVAMDLNHYMNGWNHSRPASDIEFSDCMWTRCRELCLNITSERAEQAFDLLYRRLSKATAKNMLVFSHYPSDYFFSNPEFLDALSNPGDRNLAYFGGHRHSVDQWSTARTGPHDWLVGGGGGWGCDSPQQGFVVGEIDEDFNLKTYPVLVDPHACCDR